MSRLTDPQIATAKSWLHDIFVLAKEIPDCKGSSYNCMYKTYRRDSLAKHALEIVNEMKMRNFAIIDKAFEALSDERFGSSMDDTASLTRKNAEVLAKYVAWFCYSNKIYWNDTIRGPEETKLFNETYLGKALIEYDCFATTPDRKATTGLGGSSRTPKTTSGSSTGSAAPAGGGYKGLGPMSDKARDLKGAPGDKIKLTGKVYTIEGDSSTTKSIPAAFVRPLDAAGAAGSTNKVFFGTSWKGYKNCVCFYTSESEAFEVAKKLKEDSKIPSSTSTVKVNYKFADHNGYFKVGTEYGDCYILARELNEELENPAELSEDVELSEAAKAYMSIPLEEEVYEMTNNITNPEEYFANYRKSQE